MSIEFEPLTSANAPALLKHLSDTRAADWPKAVLEDYVEWRYFARERACPIMALAKSECVAFLDGQLREYRCGAEIIDVCESSEWYCAPAYRPIGLGIRILQEYMSADYPILSVRGTEANQKLLPKLGWKNLEPVILYTKMMNWRNTARTAWRRARSTILRAERKETLVDIRVDYGPPTANEIDTLNDGVNSALAPKLCEWEVSWFSKSPRIIGEYIWLRFYTDSEFIGYSLNRLYEGREYRRAQIVHIECVADDVPLYVSVIRSTTNELAKRGAVRLLARCSSNAMSRAFSQSEYEASAPQPVFWWSKGDQTLEGTNTHLTYLRGDDSFRPLSNEIK